MKVKKKLPSQLQLENMATVQKNSSVMKYQEINKEEEKGLD